MTKGFIATVKPQSLAISVISVSVGTAVAALHGSIHGVHYFLTLLGISLLHAGSNVINDYFDFRNKIDTREVPGSYATEGRVLIQEWLRPNQVLGLALIFFALSLPIGIYLTVTRGLPVFILGFIGFLTGLFYTARPIAFKYVAMGEPAVFFIWGPLTVSGAYYVQTGQFSSQALLISLPIGILVALILFANNIRDIGFDGGVGIRTIATVLGRTRAIRVYQMLVAAVYAMALVLLMNGQLNGWVLLTWFSLPLAIKLIKILKTEVPKDADARTAQLDTAFGVLLILSILLQKWL
jgi:1,4-dihydroxy-2-naphthoate octaprenyltransferase